MSYDVGPARALLGRLACIPGKNHIMHTMHLTRDAEAMQGLKV